MNDLNTELIALFAVFKKLRCPYNYCVNTIELLFSKIKRMPLKI